ncbi:MAG: protein-glutamate O-methyltransferase CheR [Bacteroidetes bacterium]|nr:protein-glutamate O-methyltransferase CheR [Bacteroidota bacterium]
MPDTSTTWIADEQLTELIGVVRESHGFDFGAYSKSSLKRRLSRIIMLKKVSFDELKHLLLSDPSFFQWFLEEITVNVTEMFRDPFYYKALYGQVIPALSGFDHIRIWCAGCSSGEEVYSLSILLKDAGLENKSFLYGTDIHTEMLNEARRGIYPVRKIKNYEENYRQSGLPGQLTDHFNLMNDAAGIRAELRQNTLFSAHNLLTDGAFNEFQMICCRNVFIYFEAAQQEKVLNLFYDSLAPNGFMCLGAKETIRFPEIRSKFRIINSRGNIYQKIGH